MFGRNLFHSTALLMVLTMSAAQAQNQHVVRSQDPGGLNGQKLAPVVPSVVARKGLLPIILNVTSLTHPSIILALFYGLPGGPGKAAFGDRFTLAADQRPFSLQAVGADLIRFPGGGGFEVGQTIGITVLGDISSSGNIFGTEVLFNGTVVLNESDYPNEPDDFVVFSLPEPIIVSQGDIYIILTDMSTNAHPTPIPILEFKHGGGTESRSFVSLNPNTAPDPTRTGNFSPLPVIIPMEYEQGNTFVLGYGDLALPDDPISGGGQPFTESLGVPRNPMVIGSGTITLSSERLLSIGSPRSNRTTLAQRPRCFHSTRSSMRRSV